jgi:hypothetical protein
MTLQVPRLPFSLDPLIGEARRRGRQRRLLVALAALLLVGIAAGLALGFRSSGGGSGGGFAATAGSVRVGALRFTVPRGFHRYPIRGDVYRTGTRPPIIGYLVTDYGLKAGPKSTFVYWSNLDRRSPAKRVAFELTRFVPFGVSSGEVLDLPLSLDQRWFKERTRQGTPGYGWGAFRFQTQDYKVFEWIGTSAPPRDRDALQNVLASVRPAH